MLGGFNDGQRTDAVQAVQKGLADLSGVGGAAAAADALRLVDNYIKVCTISCYHPAGPAACWNRWHKLCNHAFQRRAVHAHAVVEGCLACMTARPRCV